MPNVISWTEAEINTLIQAWSEVEAKYPLLRCPRGAGTLHAKLYALFSKRCAFPRSSIAVNRMKIQIRSFVLFVHKFNQDRGQDGGRLWFDLSVDERRQRRATMPPQARNLTVNLSREAFARLMKMERAQRWLGEGSAATNDKLQDEAPELRSDSSFLSLPEPAATLSRSGTSRVKGIVPSSESSTPSTEQGAEKAEDQLTIVAQQRPDRSSCRSSSRSDVDGLSKFAADKRSPPMLPKAQGKRKKTNTDQQLRVKLKHRDCNILLEQMMKLQNKKMRQAASELRADIEGEIRRSSEMLHSIISNQFEDPGSSGDVAFVAKVLNMQQQQVHDRFDQFEEKRVRDEAANRALLG